MQIDEKAYRIAECKYRYGCGEAALREFVEAYEAAKVAEQPVGETKACAVETNTLLGATLGLQWNHRSTAQPDEVTKLELFIEQMFVALKGSKIRDFDTNWRMADQVLPPTLDSIRKKGPSEISAAYRKIHLSDIISAARDVINHYHRQPMRESRIDGHIKLLACAALGISPDSHVQSKEEYAAEEKLIMEVARHYLAPDQYPLPDEQGRRGSDE